MKLKLNDIGCSPRGALVVIGGILIHLSLGTYYTFGNFAPYMISYMRNRTDEVNLRNVDAIWVTSIGTVTGCVGMTTGGLLDKRFGPRIATAIGSIIFSSSVALTSLSIKQSFLLVVLTYGVMALLGNLMAYGPAVQTSIKWFPNRPSLATGFIVAGYGGGALIFNQVITNYINPDNLPPDLTADDGDMYFTDPDILNRVPTCFLILAASYIVMQIVGIIMVTSPSSNHVSVTVDTASNCNDIKKKTADNSVSYIEEPTTLDIYEKGVDYVVSTEKPAKQEAKDNLANREYTTKEAILKMLKSRNFYLVWFAVLAGDTGLQFVLSFYKAYGLTFITDDRFLALVGSFASVFNCTGRPLWGLFMDRFRYRISMGLIMAALAVLIATLFTTEYTGKAGFLIWICVLFLTFSGVTAILPTTMAKLFGTSNMALNYGFLQIALTVGSIVSSIFAVTLKTALGFRGLFFLGGGLNAITLAFIFFFNGKDRNGRPI